jgi:hypothetical protein
MDRLIKVFKSRISTSFPVSYLLPDKVHHTILAIILCYMGYCFLRLPILSTGDTDMWYHLSGGRYFFQHHQISTTGFFSFFAQSWEWSNYYWLFQLLIYSIYIATSYYGLIIFKTIMFLLTAIAIALFLFKDIKYDRQRIYFLILFALLSIGLVNRYYAFLRPHMFSYLFIPLFLYLLESRNRMSIILPGLTIIWINTHGIEYPVIVLVLSSYLFEFIIKRYKSRLPISRDEIYYITPLILSLFAILINPYGFKILNAPFSFANNQDQFIAELRHIDLADFFSWNFYPFGDLPWCSINILIISACIGCLKGLWNKNIRVSHLLLFSGGIFLLTQAIRFRYEALMLSLPLLRYHPLIPLFNKDAITKPAKLTALSVITLSFLIIFHGIFLSGGRYPFSSSNFPHGITTFLNHIGVGGTVLNSPVHGGYLQWELDPKYKIAMDLQTILFSDEDYFSVMSALNTKEGFASFYQRFHPDFVIAMKNNNTIKKIISAFPEYRLVFFDYSSVLYINKSSYPEIAEQYEINDIDPFSVIEEDIDIMDENRINPMLDKLLSMRTIYPDDLLTNLQIGRIYNKKNESEKALACANTIIKNSPEFSYGFVLKGDINKQLGLFDNAIDFYKKALNCPFQFDTLRILKSMALAYNRAGDDRNAYKAMKKAVYVYTEDVDYKDLWQLGNMTLKIGKIGEGLKLLQFSLIRTPEDDKNFIERLHKQIGQIESYSKPKTTLTDESKTH